MYISINKNIISPVPLHGYKRITNDNPNIEYIGDIKTEYHRSYAYNGKVHFTNENNTFIRFSIYSKKFILINPLYYDGAKINIKIDNTDYIINDIGSNNTGTTNIFEAEFEDEGFHDVIITKHKDCGSSQYLYFDCIDIDENGKIIPFLKNRYVFAINNIFYYINNNEMKVIGKEFKKDLFYNNNSDIKNYNKPLHDVLNNYSIIKI